MCRVQHSVSRSRAVRSSGTSQAWRWLTSVMQSIKQPQTSLHPDAGCRACLVVKMTPWTGSKVITKAPHTHPHTLLKSIPRWAADWMEHVFILLLMTLSGLPWLYYKDTLRGAVTHTHSRTECSLTLHIKQRLQTGNVCAKKTLKTRAGAWRGESIGHKLHGGFDLVWCLMHIPLFSLLEERQMKGEAEREMKPQTTWKHH